jgi:exopolysaccharide production protein ExoQ
MAPLLALLVLGSCVVWLLWSDVRERASVSSSTWIALAWVTIYASRPVTSWFSDSDPSLISASARDDGNPLEALVSIALLAGGLIVLYRRRLHFPDVVRQNPWFAVVYSFWILSVIWSDYPLITFKRCVRDMGNFVMAFVILTEAHPGPAVRAVLARCVYICVPLSILLIRYYPTLGRVYVGYNLNELMYVGITTQKNTLGVLALVGALLLLWEVLDRWRAPSRPAPKATLASRILVLLMCWYILVLADSATSLLCAILGSIFLLAFQLPAVKRHPWRFQTYALALLIFLSVADSFLDLKARMVLSLDRDMTLTTRTDIWPILVHHQDNPLLGAGFNTFWAGQRLLTLQNEVGGIIQAHNGYLETYLNGGLVALALLAGLLVSSYRRLATAAGSYGALRLVFLALIVLHNLTEASFFKLGLLWFVMLLVTLDYRPRLWGSASTRAPLHSPMVRARLSSRSPIGRPPS